MVSEPARRRTTSGARQNTTRHESQRDFARDDVEHDSTRDRKQTTFEAMDEQERLLAEVLGGISGGTASEMLGRVFHRCATDVAKSDYTLSCPAADLVESPGGEKDVERSARFFASVTELVAEQLRLRGLAAEEARDLATVSLAAMGGAVTLARVRRSVEPFETVLRDLLRHPSLAGSSGPDDPVIVAVR